MTISCQICPDPSRLDAGLNLIPARYLEAFRARPEKHLGLEVTASDGGKLAAGLARVRDDGRASLDGIWVHPDHRNAGHEARILATLGETLAAQGHRDIRMTLVTSDANLAPTTEALVAAGWSAPETRLSGLRIPARTLIELPWPAWSRHPGPGESIIPWDAVSARHREDFTRRRKADPALFPKALNPFHRAIDHQPDTSLALIQDDRLMGWLISHAVSPDTLQWTVSYVLPPLQRKARGLVLWRESLSRQIQATPYTTVKLEVSHGVPGMVRLLDRRLRALSSGVTLTLQSRFNTSGR